MNTVSSSGVNLVKTLIATTVASVLLAACAVAPVKPDGATEARNKLTRLQSDQNLANRAPLAIKEADAAVSAAEQPQTDKELGAYLVYMADRKVEIARAQADTSLAEDQRGALSAQREKARLDARTREADVAEGKVASARAEGAEQKVAADQARNEAGAAQLAADQARNEAGAAHLAAANSEEQAAELQRQVDALQARPTDRGLVLTLGDVLFASGKADLLSGASGNLNKLAAFLDKYPDRTVVIEGYTDNVGSEDYNQGLSERRAESVKSYLAGQGIGVIRLSALGKGETGAVGDNNSAAGRQQNRRVEVIISNPAAASR
jgi:outer membrane protein OmpA-like peptidoglycan-associated protein